MLKLKHFNTQEEWLQAWNNATNIITEKEIDNKVNVAVSQIKQLMQNNKVAAAWSGGKDSLVLGYIAERASVPSGIYIYSSLWGYQEYISWAKSVKPTCIEMLDVNIPLEWMVKNEENALFPSTRKWQDKLSGLTHRRGMKMWLKKNPVDIILTGRRVKDGNYSQNSKCTQNTSYYNIISDWSHEEVFALLKYKHIDLHKLYFIENGFDEGGLLWTSRMSNKTGKLHQWQVVDNFDKSIVDKYAQYFVSGKQYLKERK